MRSYLCVGELENMTPVGGFVECELEMVPVEESKVEEFASKPTEIVSISTNFFKEAFSEGDIFVVNHIDGVVVAVCYKDDEEKQRRIELNEKMLKKIKKV